MANTKKKPGFSKAILNLVVLLPTVFGMLKKVVTLVEFEAQLVGKNLILLIALSVAFGSMLTATWIGLLAMLYLYFQSLLWTPLLSLFILFLVNIVVLTLLVYFLYRTKKNLFFPEVRTQLKYLQRLFRK